MRRLAAVQGRDGDKGQLSMVVFGDVEFSAGSVAMFGKGGCGPPQP